MAHLPDELLAKIFSYFTPECPDGGWPTESQTLARLCRASKRYRSLAEPYLYYNIPFWNFVVHRQSMAGLQVLSDRLELGTNVQHITVSGSHDFINMPLAQITNAARSFILKTYDADVLAFLEDLISEPVTSIYHPPDIARHNREKTLALLITLTPNLKSLCLATGALENPPIAKFFSFCRSRLEDKNTYLPLSAPPRTPLSNLRSMRINHAQKDGESTMDNVRMFSTQSIAPVFAFPLLETCYVEGEELDDEDEFYREYEEQRVDSTFQPPAPRSRPHMRRLHFETLDIGKLRPFDRILGQFPNLDTLILHLQNAGDNGELTEEERCITDYGEAFRQHGGKLKHLEFQSRDLSDGAQYRRVFGALGPLRDDLIELVQLRTTLEHLIGRRPEPGGVGEEFEQDEASWREGANLKEYLPARLRYFWTKLGGDYVWDDLQEGITSDHLEALEGLFLDTDDYLPELEWILICCEDIETADRLGEHPGWKRSVMGEQGCGRKQVEYRKENGQRALGPEEHPHWASEHWKWRLYGE